MINDILLKLVSSFCWLYLVSVWFTPKGVLFLEKPFPPLRACPPWSRVSEVELTWTFIKGLFLA